MLGDEVFVFLVVVKIGLVVIIVTYFEQQCVEDSRITKLAK